jgi:3-keto-5-aminohexanoate cleavage enzyme
MIIDKVIITVAPTGNVPTREMNPHVPLTPDEIAEDVYRCYQAGASIAHIHARDEAGEPTTAIHIFREIVEKIRKRCDIVIQLSTGARGGSLEERGQNLKLKPEMASLTTGSSNFSNSVNYNPPQFIEQLARRMLDYQIKPEIEIFDLSMIANAGYLCKKGLFREPLHYNLVLNVPGSLDGTAKNLYILKESLKEGSTWTVSAIGKSHRDLTALALLLNGHLRVGLEDVLELDGKPVTNLELVQRAAALVKQFGRQAATPEEARKILGVGALGTGYPASFTGI